MTGPRDDYTSPTLGDLQSPAVKRCPQCKLLYFDGGHDPETCDGKGGWTGVMAEIRRNHFHAPDGPLGKGAAMWGAGAAMMNVAPTPEEVGLPAGFASVREAGTIVVHDERPFTRCARCSHKPRAPGELDCVDCLRDAVLE